VWPTHGKNTSDAHDCKLFVHNEPQTRDVSSKRLISLGKLDYESMQQNPENRAVATQGHSVAVLPNCLCPEKFVLT